MAEVLLWCRLRRWERSDLHAENAFRRVCVWSALVLACSPTVEVFSSSTGSRAKLFLKKYSEGLANI